MKEVHVKGLAELQKFLDEFPPKVERNIMRAALRAGMSLVLPIARHNIHSVSHLLAEGLKLGTKTRGGLVIANIKALGPHGFVAKFVEFGTAPHKISAKDGALSFGGIFSKSIKHPGAKPHKFMRPALDSQAQAAVIAVAEYMKKRLATKEGLDTSHIMIEGDE